MEVVTATLTKVVMAVMLPRLLSMAVFTCSLGIKKWRQEDLIFEASMHCPMKPFLKTTIANRTPTLKRKRSTRVLRGD